MRKIFTLQPPAMLVWALFATAMPSERAGAASAAPSSSSDNRDAGLTIGLGETLAYDDNLFRLSAINRPLVLQQGAARSIDDYLSRTTLGLGGSWTPGRQALSLSLRIDANRFLHNDQLDHESGDARATWSWRLGNSLSGELGGAYTRALAGFAYTDFYAKDLLSSAAYFGEARYALTPRWNLLLDARHADAAHSAAARADDDYDSNSGGAQLQFVSRKGNSIGAEYRFRKTRFDELAIVDGQVFDRDYDESTSQLKLRYSPWTKTTLTASGGYLERDYPGGVIGDFSGEIWRAEVDYAASAKLRLEAAAWRELQAYVDAESDYFVSRGASFGPSWNATVKLTLSLAASWERQRHIGASSRDVSSSDPLRNEKVTALTAQANYRVALPTQIGLSWRYEKRSSNRAQLAYDDNFVNLSVRYLWQ